jgi:hypothetical protein
MTGFFLMIWFNRFSPKHDDSGGGATVHEEDGYDVAD